MLGVNRKDILREVHQNIFLVIKGEIHHGAK